MLPTIISAVNNDQLLKSCLLASPDLRPDSAVDVIIQSGFDSAAVAYNSAMRRAKTDILIFAHQDVYLPEGWIPAVSKAIGTLTVQDPNWGVLGVYGIRNGGEGAGYLYYTDILGKDFDGGVEVRTLDELLLIVRGSSGLSFDERLRGFHMYGPDICLEAGRRGMKNYVISAFCIHNSQEYRMMPLQFWKAYLFMRRKWAAQLPIKTSCTEITRHCWPAIRWILIRSVNLALGKEKLHGRAYKRMPDPGRIYNALIRDKVVGPPAAGPRVPGESS